jgi:hypothetical membrane protein
LVARCPVAGAGSDVFSERCPQWGASETERIMTDTLTSSSVAPRAAGSEVVAARLATAAILTYQALSWAVAVVNPQWNPLTRQLSEYALGHHGWLMVAAFLASGLAYLALAVAIRSQVRGLAGRIGVNILGCCAVGSVGVGVFVTDPMSTPVEDISTRGTLHFVFGFSALLLLPIAALLVTGALARRHPQASPTRRRLRLVALLPVAGFAGIWVPEVAGLFRVGGWPDRALFLTYTAWVLIVAAHAGRATPEAAPVEPQGRARS